MLQAVNEVRKRGWVGVDLFFVLSGFLITGILFDTRHDSKFFQRFFARRALRILPAFYVLVAVVLMLTPIVQYKWRPGHLWFLLYLGNVFANHDGTLYEVFSVRHRTFSLFIGHFWSLCVEEQFYLLWPLVVWGVRDRRKLLWTAGVLSAVALGLRVVVCARATPAVAELWIVRTLPFRMDALLLGGMLALLLRGPNAAVWQKRCGAVFRAAAVGVVGVMVSSPAYESPWLLTVGLTLTALAGAGLVGMTVRSGSAAFRLFYRAPLRFVGRYSYGFYLFHVLFGRAWIGVLLRMEGWFHSMALAGLVALPLNYCLTLLAAMASYELVEVRFLRWKPRFAYDSERVDETHGYSTK